MALMVRKALLCTRTWVAVMQLFILSLKRANRGSVFSNFGQTLNANQAANYRHSDMIKVANIWILHLSPLSVKLVSELNEMTPNPQSNGPMGWPSLIRLMIMMLCALYCQAPDMPENLWPELLKGLNHVYNRSPSSPLNGKSPLEIPQNLQITQWGWEDVLDCPGRTTRSGNSAFLTRSNEPAVAPTSYPKAMQSQDKEEWSDAILQELMSPILKALNAKTLSPKVNTKHFYSIEKESTPTSNRY
jgi:hypothetical protein